MELNKYEIIGKNTTYSTQTNLYVLSKFQICCDSTPEKKFSPF